MKTLPPHKTTAAAAGHREHKTSAVDAAHIRLLAWILGEPEEVTARRIGVLLDDDRWVYDATAMFGPADGGWDLSVIGRNLSDEEGFSWGNDVPLFGGSYAWSPNAPRSVTVRGRLHF